MNNKQTKDKIISSLFWKLAERLGSHGIQFVVSIVLARLLLPSDYGAIAMITIFTSIANVFVQSGFSSSLIQKKEVSDEDFSSVFFMTLIIATVMYVILYLLAPFIASYYNMPEIVAPLRVISITLFFGAINSVQLAKVSRSLKFKKIFFSSLISIIVSGAVGIGMAYKNMGIWALVGQQVASYITITVVLWFTVKWRPRKYFSFHNVKELFRYGKNILVSSLLDTVYNEIYTLVIGKKFSKDMLGYYSKGKLFPNFIVQNVNGAISAVMFPALSIEQDQKEKLKRMVRRSIKTSCYLIFPLMLGLCVVAEPLVKLLLTDKWLSAVPFLQIMCLVLMWYPLHVANLEVIKALGESGLYLRLEIIKKVVGIVILICSVPFGIYVMAASQIVASLLCLIINAWPNKKLLHYSLQEQFKDILPYLLLSIVMLVPVYLITYLGLSSNMTLLMQVMVGGITYLLLSKIFKVESYNYLLNTLKETFHKKVNKERMDL